ncbi:MAG: hypothetical protein SVY53_01930, partial [Chloroflexota bacterium]|nr:hypothetical protein [Chloroflexota bacterium]
KILASLMIIGLIGAVIGAGFFADYPDSETSEGNKITAGTMDLKVNDADDPCVGASICLDCVTPCNTTDYYVKVSNVGCVEGLLYMEYQNILGVEDAMDVVVDEPCVPCETASEESPCDQGDSGDCDQTDVDACEDNCAAATCETICTNPSAQDTCVTTNEPEHVAECGGQIGGLTVAGLGADFGANGEMAQWLDVVTMVFDEDGDGVLDNPDNGVGTATEGNGQIEDDEFAQSGWIEIEELNGMMDSLGTGSESESSMSYLGVLGENADSYIYVSVHLLQIEDEDWQGDPMFKYWPTNAMQGDTLCWDVMYALFSS